MVLTGDKLAAASRDYKVMMRLGDVSLARWAERTGGCLALAPHNVHVAEEGRKEGREQYGTRWRDRVGQLVYREQGQAGQERRVSASSSSSISSEVCSEAGSSKPAQKGWNSFGSFQIPKKPKPAKPCPKSMRGIVATKVPGEVTNEKSDNVVFLETTEISDVKTEVIQNRGQGPSSVNVEIKESKAAAEEADFDLDFLDNVEFESKKEEDVSEYLNEDMILEFLDPQQ